MSKGCSDCNYEDTKYNASPCVSCHVYDKWEAKPDAPLTLEAELDQLRAEVTALQAQLAEAHEQIATMQALAGQPVTGVITYAGTTTNTQPPASEEVKC